MRKSIVRKIERWCAENKRVVVVPREGEPSRVFLLERYKKIEGLPKLHKPWESRRGRRAGGVDPLGAVEGKVRTALSRDDIYSKD